ncbi:MAG: FtsX-like permease family protein [Tissierellia bacterium]|nr:FtsX-like permease family protein [Tissierellia bacterium]MDD4780489.1 FtsX-like permease family protein [Tissierellia bacterium]
MKNLDKRLFRLIKLTKGQYIAVLLIVITGIFVFTAVKNSALNLNDTLNDYYNSTNFADVFVTAVSIPKDISTKLIGEANIAEVEERLVFDTLFITDDSDKKVNVRVVSVEAQEDNINKLFMKSGKRSLTSKDIIIIDQFAAARNIKVGDEVKLQISGRQYLFKVSGIASSPEYVYIMENEQTLLPEPSEFGVVFIEESYLMKIAQTNGNYNELVLKVKDEKKLEKTVDYLKSYLDKYGVKRVIKRDEQLSNSMIHEEINGLEKVSQSIPVVFLLFSGIMLSSMLSRIVKKDRTSIGVLKALGFTDIEIIIHYLKYAASIGFVGGLVGSLIGTALSGGMTNIYLDFFNIPMLTIKVYYSRIALSIVLSLIFCVLSGMWGIRGIIKINPAESMLPEAPKKGKRILLEKFKFLWRRLPFSWKIIFRNIFREKRKFVFIGAAVAVTCGMMIMTLWMNDIIDVMFIRHYNEFSIMEYNVVFNSFKDKKTKMEVEKLVNSSVIEGKVELPFEIYNKDKSKIVNVIGLEKNTVFYNFKDIDGYDLELPDEGILISSNLATFLNVNKGDKILLKNFIPDKDDDYVTIKGIIKQSLGINGYMNIDYLNAKFLDIGIINGVYLNSKEDVESKLNSIKNISSIQSQNDMIGIFEEFTGLIAVTIGVMIIFSGILGFVIMYSMTLMSINERTLEFSSLRVMGFTQNEIFQMIVKENMIMSLLGIIIGIPLGKYLVDYLSKTFSTDIYTMSEPITLQGIIISIIITIIFLILAQMMTYVKIHKLNFIDSLKSRIS